ncbi:MAG: allantoinase AllB [Planctomycetes bacterium]|nr:allantoinase AllB [Planctomycetota bacterium]
MNYSVLLRGGTVVTRKGSFRWDIAVADGTITRIADRIDEPADNIIDASGLHILPGLIDSHVHFDEPGTEREGFLTGSASLIASGVTAFFDNPITSNPPTIHAEAFAAKREAGLRNSLLDFGIIAGMMPENFDQLQSMRDSGAIAIKGFMSRSTGLSDFHHMDDESLIRAMDRLARMGAVMILHAENEAICSYLTERNARLGLETFADYETTRPVVSEVESVRRAALFAEITGCKVHIFHVSSRLAVAEAVAAKTRGVDITVETCPHYLSLTTQDFPTLNGAKCSPPLRDIRHVESMWEAVRAGEVDTIGSDHSSMPRSENRFGGLSGGQSTLAVLLEEGYFRRGVPLETLVGITSWGPAKRFGLVPRKGDIALGYDADFAIVDLNKTYTLRREDLLDRQKHSQYVGRTFRGAVEYTVSRGETVYRSGKLLAKPRRARLLSPLDSDSERK